MCLYGENANWEKWRLKRSTTKEKNYKSGGDVWDVWGDVCPLKRDLPFYGGRTSHHILKKKHPKQDIKTKCVAEKDFGIIPSFDRTNAFSIYFHGGVDGCSGVVNAYGASHVTAPLMAWCSWCDDTPAKQTGSPHSMGPWPWLEDRTARFSPAHLKAGLTPKHLEFSGCSE